MIISKEQGLKAIYGGLFLGGGGGGSLEGGLHILEETFNYGDLKIHNIDEFKNEDLIITASLVGSPASKEKYVGNEHYKRVYDLYKQVSKDKITGIMTNEIGAQAITNGWMLSAMEDIPLIDAACNGRAHPTGAMGSMGLNSKLNYTTIQTAAGGKGKKDISLSVKGSVASTSELIVRSSIEAGGFVTVLRNPINIEYIKSNGAINSITYAIKVGEIFIESEGNPSGIMKGLSNQIGVELVSKGEIYQLQLETIDGLDVGYFKMNSEEGSHEIIYWNEYMTIDDNRGERVATFPDLICVLDAKTGMPILSSELELGMEVILVKLDKDKLILGKSMYDMNLLKDAEKCINRELVKYF